MAITLVLSHKGRVIISRKGRQETWMPFKTIELVQREDAHLVEPGKIVLGQLAITCLTIAQVQDILLRASRFAAILAVAAD